MIAKLNLPLNCCMLLVVFIAAGCPVTQSQDTPVDELHMRTPITGEKYWLYVPDQYDSDKPMPLVVTLHGTNPWDGYHRQVKEWKALAEDKGFIVAAPKLKSSQGIIRISRSMWYDDLEEDEKAILAVIEDVGRRYRIDKSKILLTGFSAGGYAMYFTGLRNPDKFQMLVARACNSDVEMMRDKIQLTDASRKLPIVIFWGKDDSVIVNQSWEAFEYLRMQKCYSTSREEIRGGHLRRPDLAYQLWSQYLK
jgi:poly(3-hydroxybutyrate) depolymerase